MNLIQRENFGIQFRCPRASEEPSLVKAPFISCHTRRGWLFGAEHNKPFHLSLATADGTRIGYLVILEDENSGLNNQQQSQGPLEIVEIAGGYRNDEYDWSDKNKYEAPELEIPIYFHVMWIEWKGNIAYRRGLGRVSEEAWIAQNREYIDLTLG